MSIANQPYPKCYRYYGDLCANCRLVNRGDCIFEIVLAAGSGYTFSKLVPGEEGQKMTPRGGIILLRRRNQGKVDERIGRNIKRIREIRSMTQQELAVKMDTTQGRISDVETGKRRVSITFLEDMEGVLECDIVEFFLNI